MEDKLINKAGEMFLSLGFKSVTMDDIANELGVSKKTIYKYYPNKASLVKASTEAIHGEVEIMVRAIKEKNLNAIEEEFAIKAIFKEMLKNAKESPMFQLKKYYPKIHGELMEKEECLFRDCNEDNLEKGIQQGLYRKDIDIEMIMNFYFILIFGVFDKNIANNDISELVKMEYKVLEYHIRAIATEKGLEELNKQLRIIKQNN